MQNGSNRPNPVGELYVSGKSPTTSRKSRLLFPGVYQPQYFAGNLAGQEMSWDIVAAHAHSQGNSRAVIHCLARQCHFPGNVVSRGIAARGLPGKIPGKRQPGNAGHSPGNFLAAQPRFPGAITREMRHFPLTSQGQISWLGGLRLVRPILYICKSG